MVTNPPSPTPIPAPTADQELVLRVARAWDGVLAEVERALSHIKGISFAEYRLLRAIGDAPGGRASRVDLAARVRLSPSGVTRALRPLEKLGFVETHRQPRDARLALAGLTAAGRDLVADASAVVDDAASAVIARAPAVDAARDTLADLLSQLASPAR